MYILDSTVIIDIMKGTETAEKITSMTEEEFIATTVFSLFEVFLGLKEHERQAARELFNSMQILHFDPNASFESVEIEKDLTKSGKKINLVDVFIAGICIANKCTLITSDKDFEKIKRLDARTVS